MKFPGRRKNKHYFPVSERGREALETDFHHKGNVYITGIIQPIVDIEITTTNEFLNQMNFKKCESFLVDDTIAEKIYNDAKNENRIRGEYPGETVANTLHNFSMLSDTPCVALGSIHKNITVGDYVYKYISKTSSRVDLTYLQPCERLMGRALALVTEDGERTFAVSKGCMNDLSAEFVPEKIVQESATLVLSAYLLRDEQSPIFEATLKACKIAKASNVPIVLSMGTSSLVEAKREFFMNFITEYVNVVAMNSDEAFALTKIDDPLLAASSILEITDLCLITVGAKGLYLAGYVDEDFARLTKEALHTKSIVEYNRYEYSRGMKKADCKKPIKIYSHINPFLGGPQAITNTNGAGDAALSALLHDMSANVYHKQVVPNSPKHQANYLTYSSLSQISKYANRVSYEVLMQNSPRLTKGLPQKEDALEESYWER
ncbi:MAG: inosine/guanosine kinase [Bacteriovoracaceae bacterium]|nr:inosine/guanosine kinase [Bacteriovoracaceae bacterium]